MNLGLRNAMSVNVTVISNEFIDTYMAPANGEYVKVFLYLLRHEQEDVTVSVIADALNHTEADVKRALSYWKEVGVLAVDAQDDGETAGYGGQREHRMAAEHGGQREHRMTAGYGGQREYRMANVDKSGCQQSAAAESLATAQTSGGQSRVGSQNVGIRGQGMVGNEIPDSAEGIPLVPIPEPGNSFERRQKLAEDADFKALTYVVQQYLGKMLTSMEMEMFEYLYDDLKMSSDLLEYLVEYCAGSGHKSIRYIEKVALNWYQMGIKTREEARDYTMRFSRDMSSVMKAFGITNRNPGTAEQEYMKKWFKEYGFDTVLVKEACDRTITATGSASFPYADKILAGWKESGVRTLGDVQELDKRRQMTKAQKEKQAGNAQGSSRSGNQKYGGQKSGGQRIGGSGSNRFKNFEERSYDYENLVWEGMRKRQKGGSGDGTQ